MALLSSLNADEGEIALAINTTSHKHVTDVGPRPSGRHIQTPYEIAYRQQP